MFQSEITAIAAAAARLDLEGNTNREITIYSDSQAAVRSLEARFTRSTIVAECSQKLRKLAENNSVTLQWIPGHAGYEGNERADELAKEGSITDLYGPEPVIPISLNTVKLEIHRLVNQLHCTEWANRTDCRQSKMFCPTPSRRVRDEILGLKRKEARDVIQIMSGHANLARHRYKTGHAASPLCAQCGQGEEETALHHLGNCPRYGFVRIQTLNRILVLEEDLPTISLRLIGTFLKRTKRLDNFNDEGP